jgi:hypothetical protein
VIGRDSSTKSPRKTSPESKGIQRGSSPLPSCRHPHQQQAKSAAQRQTAHRTHRKSGRLSPSSWPSPVGVARPPKKGPKALWGRATPSGEGQDGGLRPRVLARALRPSEAKRGRARPNAAERGQTRPNEAKRGQSSPPAPTPQPQARRGSSGLGSSRRPPGGTILLCSRAILRSSSRSLSACTVKCPSFRPRRGRFP